jgi:ATP synthase protein I
VADQRPGHGKDILGKGSGTDSPNRSMWEELSRQTGVKAHRKIKARDSKKGRIWYAMGMLGLVGWSVVIPPLVGVLLGSWIDRHLNMDISWTLMLFLIGLGMGLWNAWNWLKHEGMKEEGEQDMEDENVRQ